VFVLDKNDHASVSRVAQRKRSGHRGGAGRAVDVACGADDAGGQRNVVCHRGNESHRSIAAVVDDHPVERCDWRAVLAVVRQHSLRIVEESGGESVPVRGAGGKVSPGVLPERCGADNDEKSDAIRVRARDEHVVGQGVVSHRSRVAYVRLRI